MTSCCMFDNKYGHGPHNNALLYWTADETCTTSQPLTGAFFNCVTENLIVPLTQMRVKDNQNTIETGVVVKTNIEIHRTWGQGEIFGANEDYRDFFTTQIDACQLRKDCELEIVASPESRCIGTHAGSCGVTMINKSEFTKAGGKFVPGKLVIDTNQSTFVDQ